MHLSITARRHGWQRPLHPLQIVEISVLCFLVASFYCFLGIFLSNKIAEITFITVFSFAAVSTAVLFIRCTAIDFVILRSKSTASTAGLAIVVLRDLIITAGG
ncbi:unnamed protein product [Fraxinus pennsylvanica]|uniref:Uncharacterized protein n=1 Tax=Fraxinus pennsylvanica TaxID=56036 RepID=A0AAD1Z160_9LAMI|nr:unnamed protein product [Fraxinus pennsylvanica]